MNPKAVANRIQQIMQQNGMNQKTLAAYLGVSQPAVSLYLQGRLPPADILLKIARLGRTTVEWLLEGERLPPDSGSRVAETSSLYGKEAALLDVWKQLPTPLQEAFLQLLRVAVQELKSAQGQD